MPVDEVAENQDSAQGKFINSAHHALGEEISPEKESSKDLDAMSFKAVSEISEATQESYPEGYIHNHGGPGAHEDLIDFEKLKEKTMNKI